jgi:hypothetical protein
MSQAHDRDAEIALAMPEATDLLFVEQGDGTWVVYGHPRMTIPKAVVTETGVNYRPLTKHVISQDDMLEVTRWAEGPAQLYYHLAVWRKSRYVNGEHTKLVIIYSTRPAKPLLLTDLF